MAYEGDVRRVLQTLRSTGSDTRNKQNQVNSIVGQRTQYWKGSASDAFSNEYGGINSDADTILRCIDRACDALGRLPSLIDRAERERKQAAEKTDSEGTILR